MGIVLDFGDGADSDTWEGVFGHLAGRYVIEVNGTDIVCDTTTFGDDTGLGGLVWDNDTGGPVLTERAWFAWDDIRSVVIH